jgi:hypothetical protein
MDIASQIVADGDYQDHYDSDTVRNSKGPNRLTWTPELNAIYYREVFHGPDDAHQRSDEKCYNRQRERRYAKRERKQHQISIPQLAGYGLAATMLPNSKRNQSWTIF